MQYSIPQLFHHKIQFTNLHGGDQKGPETACIWPPLAANSLALASGGPKQEAEARSAFIQIFVQTFVLTEDIRTDRHSY